MPNEGMDRAAAEAETEWHNFPDAITKEQLKDWIGSNFSDAGYKRLCKIILGETYTTEID